MNIRPVTVEFLREGPRHNQLLSPLTPYLAVCGDSPAGVVKMPYEHAVFERRRQELRYAVSSEADEARRRGILDQTGREMAEILALVPGLPGVISARVTQEFLSYSLSRGNDLITPRPDWRFTGLKPGDRWCLCAARWLEAWKAGVAPPVVLESTHEKALEVVPLDVLQAYAYQPVRPDSA